jgi:hypothetical protein
MRQDFARPLLRRPSGLRLERGGTMCYEQVGGGAREEGGMPVADNSGFFGYVRRRSRKPDKNFSGREERDRRQRVRRGT